VVLGIPDFRVFPDPYIAPEDDWHKGRRLQERAAKTDFRGLLEYYWSITPEEPRDLVSRYVRYDMAGAARGRHTLEVIERRLPACGAEPGRRVLELGCRTGGFLVAAAERGAQVTGIDIAFRWLVVARKRLEELALPGQVACCCAQQLPFTDSAFDLVAGGNVLEHTVDQESLIREAHRVLRPAGAFFALTCNRFSLAGEPHVRVWGVGFLPRRWMSAWVRLVRGHPYRHVRLVSVFELRRMLSRTPFQSCRIELPEVSEAEQEGLAPRERALVALYNRLKSWPVLRWLLLLFGPLLQVLCVRAAERRT
jgi:SAM-dependent methyltransferase